MFLNFRYSVRLAIVTVFLLIWIFGGWPVIWRSPISQFPPKVNTAQAAVSFKKATFTSSVTAAKQQISGVGFQPKAVIFFWSSQTAEGVTSGSGQVGLGLATVQAGASSTRAIAYCTESGNAGGDSDTAVRMSTSTIILMAGDGTSATACGTLVGRADLISLDSDGFTLTWLTTSTSAYIIHYTAIGGDDITNVKISTFSQTNTTGDQTVSGVGFQPDFVMLMSANTTSYNANVAQGRLAMGFSTNATATQAAVGFIGEDAQTAADTRLAQSTEVTPRILKQFLAIGNPPPIDGETIFVEMTSDGFKINKPDATANTHDVFYLAIKGGQHKVAHFDQRSGAGTQQVTGVGFQPVGLFMLGAMTASSSVAANGAFFTLGAAGSATSSVGLVGLCDADGDTTPDPDMRTVTTKIVHSLGTCNNATAAVTTEAHVSTFDSNGFTLNWTTGDTTLRQISYWAIGSAPTNAAPTVSSVAISPSPINVTESGTTTVTITATITDTNGCDDVFTNGTTTATLYRSGVGASCSADANNCYVNIPLFEVGDTCTGGADTAGDASGTVQIWYIAQATDASSTFSGETWQTTVKAIDAANASSTATGNAELNTLLAIDVTGTINYGTVNPGATSTTVSASTTNTGNFNSTDAQFSGTNLESGANSIAVGQQRYSTTTSEAWDSLDYTLSGSATFRELNIAKATATTSPSQQGTFWAVQVPSGQAAGTYTGTTTITAQ